MTDTAGTPHPAGRFSLASFPEGAVLLDLDSGAYYRINRSATQIGEGLLAGKPPAEVAWDLAQTWGLSPEQAHRDVETVNHHLKATAAVRHSSVSPLRFEANAAGHTLIWEDTPLLDINPAANLLTRRAWPRGGEGPDVGAALLWAVPHLLLLTGRLVLHASGVIESGGVAAFSGASGQGKTTTAKFLADQGRSLVSEDLVILTLEREVPEVWLDGEVCLRRWVEENARVLENEDRLSTAGLADVLRGSRRPLERLVFLERSPHSDPVLSLEPLSPPDALALLLANGFAEVGQRAVWRFLFEANRQLAARIPACRLFLPQGLGPLRQALADYSRTVRS